MERNNLKRTSDLPDSKLENENEYVHEEIRSSSLTKPKQPETYTKTSIIDNASTTSMVASIPMPSIPSDTFAGKTLGQWSIDRRRVSRGLSDKWDLAASKINTPGFAVYVDELISEIDKQMPLFRGIPYEDSFSGILQIIRDALTGQNFCKVQEGNLQNMFSRIFSILKSEERLLLHHYNEVIHVVTKNGILAGIN